MTSENAQSENIEEMEEYELDDDEQADVPSQSAGDTKGIEEDDISKEDEFSRIGDSSDDPDQKQRYLEYLDLIKEMDCQNTLIDEIKLQIMELCAKPCKTRCEFKDIKRLRCCMEKENLKLQCLMKKAINLQNVGSPRRYRDLPIATTLDEDNMAPYVGCIPPQNWKVADSSEAEPCPCPCPSPDGSRKRDNQHMQSLCDAIGKMKICCPEDKKLIKDIVTALMCSKKKKHRSPDPCSHKQHQSPCRKQQSHQHHQPCEVPICEQSDPLEKLRQKINCMQSSVDKLKQEICKREREKVCAHEEANKSQESSGVCDEEPDQMVQCGGKRKSEQMDKLKENYLYLLSEFAKKDCQLKELEQRMKGICGSCEDSSNGKGSNVNASEIKLLRTRVNELKEEQVEFKCIMKEQSQQLEDYRNKYLVAQQKVEEQSVTLEKLNMNNKRIEKQINTEIKDIRTKFQAKLTELLHFPKLLENEQLKLAQACKEKEDLQSKLILVCKELKTLKAQAEGPKETTDCRPQLIKCQMELSQKKTKVEELEKQRDLLCEQLKSTQDDLDTLRTESAKIIARTKERSEAVRQQQQEQIDRLEKELAQCRATACLSVSDREAVIREMQGQLNTLAYSFDAAQKQIKTLRNHIAYVTNENCFPIKC